MARPTDPPKSLAGQRRLQQFSASGMTASKLCDREGVSVASPFSPLEKNQLNKLITCLYIKQGNG